MSDADDVLQSVFYKYHSETKHTLAKLRSRPHVLDWENQPDPFRRYDGAPTVVLPIPQRPVAVDYFTLAVSGDPPPITLQTVSNLLYYAMAISAWKEVPDRGLRWSLRVNPSSGNLHPTETHVIACGIGDLPDGCYHFRVDEFTLEARYQGSVDAILQRLGAECDEEPRRLTLVLTSVFWREAWKYRERAFRYCHLDLGHALASVVEALMGLGYAPTYRHVFDDARVATLLGLQDSDERPGAIVSAGPSIEIPEPNAEKSVVEFRGEANRLSREIIRHDAIEAVYEATCHSAKRQSAPLLTLQVESKDQIALPTEHSESRDFWHVVRTRRSAVAFDAKTGITLRQLGAVLRRATESVDGDVMDFRHDAGGRFFIHLFLYVHRVEGLEPGLYHYDRKAHRLGQVHAGDVRRHAMQLSLHQEIAADSAVAFSMVADFTSAQRCFGERGYRAVHLEAGYIGQGLYLGAESIGTNATGIGAFFDDDVNRLLALPPGFEVVYHFTIGRAVPDHRLRQRKAYRFETDAGELDTVEQTTGGTPRAK